MWRRQHQGRYGPTSVKASPERTWQDRMWPRKENSGHGANRRKQWKRIAWNESISSYKGLLVYMFYRKIVPKRRIVVLTKTIPHYRVAFFERLFQLNSDILVVHSTKPTKDGLVDTDKFEFDNTRVACVETPWFYLQFALKYACVKRYPLIILPLELKSLVAMMLWCIAMLTQQKVVWWGHGYNVHLGKGIKYRLDRIAKSFLMRRCHKVLLYTDCNLTELNCYRELEDKIIVLNNTIDDGAVKASLAQVRDKDIERVNSCTRKSSHTVAFVGRLTKRKRPLLLIEIARRLANMYDDLRFLIIGDGECAEEMRKCIREQQLEDHVFMVGSINDFGDLGPYLIQTQVMVQPHAAGLSVPLSLSFGIPFATLNAPGHGPEIVYIEHGRTGYIAHDLDALVEWTAKILSDHEYLRVTQALCLDKVKREVNMSGMVNAFISALY